MRMNETVKSLWDRMPIVISVGAVIFSSVGAYLSLGFEIRTLDRWRLEHLEHHRERAADLATKEGALRASVDDLRKQGEEQRRRTDELSFRIGATEESGRATAKALADLQASVNEQASDLRVVREILERMDPRSRAP